MNRITMLAGLILLGIIIEMYSCEQNTVTPASLPTGCDTTNLTYTNTMEVLINTNCGTMNANCHSFGTSHDFTTYASLQRYATGGQNSRMWKEIFVLQQMPLYPELPLDPCASNQFKAWLLNNAPQ
jgi:hypothetical protein